MATRDRVIAFMHVSLFKENALGEYRTLITRHDLVASNEEVFSLIGP